MTVNWKPFFASDKQDQFIDFFFFPVCYLLRAFNPFRLREYHVSLFIITFLLSFSLGFHSLSYLLFHLNILQEAV